ncbi:MAG: hypothetical protein O3A53_20310 [Acidobacteria bacterium]|nr:hypothetical protein [Acidobacteriota bacterium]
MSLFDPQALGSLRRGRFRYLPVVPGRMEFAEAVRQEILREPPQLVAVELPATLEDAYGRSVQRLPELSIIIYDSDAGDEAVYVPVEATDPFVEALRSAGELGIPSAFLDPDLSDKPHVEDVYPDTYAATRIGLQKYVESFRMQPRESGDTLLIHAEGAAWKLQGCDPEAEILVVISLNLLDPLLEAMEQPQTQPLRKSARRNVRALNLHPDSLAEILTDAPFVQAAYEARRGSTLPEAQAPQTTRRNAQGWSIVENSPFDPKFKALEGWTRRELNRQQINLSIFAAAEQVHERKTGERLSHWQRRLWARYARNLALTQNQLLPPLFDMIVAAQSIVDDNFAWEFWQVGGWYPFQKTETDLQTVEVSGEQMWVDRRQMRLRRRTQRPKGRPKPVGLKGKKGERFPGEWKSQWKNTGICSYPPEDIVIEDFGVFLKKKGKSILSDEQTRVEPFSTSLRDGIDLRETLRNWHNGKKIYVRENQRVSGEVGAVVLIFDEERDDRYPYCITWLGEHQN